jgi:hypothetical protein
MTFEQMHLMMDVLMDKTTMPWVDPMQKDVYLNLALDDWPNWLYEGFEKTARRRMEFANLVRHHTYGNGKLLKKADTPTLLRYVVGMRGEWWFYAYDDAGKVVEEKDWMPVVPMGHDELGVAYTDPDRVPTDNFPVYTEYRDASLGEVFEIHSDNVPLRVEVSYLEDFGKVDGLNDPTGSLQLPDAVCRKIVQLAAVKAQAGMMDPRYEAGSAELGIRNEN